MLKSALLGQAEEAPAATVAGEAAPGSARAPPRLLAARAMPPNRDSRSRRCLSMSDLQLVRGWLEQEYTADPAQGRSRGLPAGRALQRDAMQITCDMQVYA